MSDERTRRHRGTDYAISAAHPAAEAFPWLDEDEVDALADDIAENGQQYKVVVLPDGRVIDGRNRELACRVAGVAPQYRTEDMDDDAVIAFVVSANIHRRALTASQRAMVAAELANLKRGENKNDGKNGIRNVADLTTEAQKNKASQADAAQMMGVSERSVSSAVKVKDKAPELTEAVKGGAIDVHTAAKIAGLPAKARKKVAKAADPKAAAKKVLEAEVAKPKLVVVPAEDEDPENPTPDPRFMPNAMEAAAFAAQFSNWVPRLRAVHTEVKKALPDRNHVLANRINVGAFLATLKELVDTLDGNIPDRVCPVCVGTGTEEGKPCKYCDSYGIVDKGHHSGLKAKWKHTRARLNELRGAA